MRHIEGTVQIIYVWSDQSTKTSSFDFKINGENLLGIATELLDSGVPYYPVVGVNSDYAFVLLDPNRQWAIREYELKTSWSHVTAKIEYRRDYEGRPVLPRVQYIAHEIDNDEESRSSQILTFDRFIHCNILAGADSDVCVRDTAAHGFALGYTPVFTGDALAADNQVGHVGALQAFGERYRNVDSTEAIVAVWRS